MKKFGSELRNVFGNPKSKKIKNVPLSRYEVIRYGNNENSQSSENEEVIPF